MALIQQLQQELQNQRMEIQTLRTDVQRLQTQPPFPRSSLPDPPRFDGKSYTLRTWLPSIRAKLRSSHLTGADAFDYVWDRLEQPQQASVLHIRQSAEISQTWDPEILFQFFIRLCHNPREHQEAVQRLTTIRQRDDESLIAYLARFERFIYEADALSWPDVTRVTALHRGLRSTLRQSLEESNDSLFSLPYDSYVELVQRTDRRSHRPQHQKDFQKPTRAPEPIIDDPMQIVALDIDSFSTTSPSIISSRCSSTHRHEHRIEKDLCFYCGSSEHWIADCRQRALHLSSSPQPPRTKLTAKRTGSPVRSQGVPL